MLPGLKGRCLPRRQPRSSSISPIAHAAKRFSRRSYGRNRRLPRQPTHAGGISGGSCRWQRRPLRSRSGLRFQPIDTVKTRPWRSRNPPRRVSGRRMSARRFRRLPMPWRRRPSSRRLKEDNVRSRISERARRINAAKNRSRRPRPQMPLGKRKKVFPPARTRLLAIATRPRPVPSRPHLRWRQRRLPCPRRPTLHRASHSVRQLLTNAVRPSVHEKPRPHLLPYSR